MCAINPWKGLMKLGNFFLEYRWLEEEIVDKLKLIIGLSKTIKNKVTNPDADMYYSENPHQGSTSNKGMPWRKFKR